MKMVPVERERHANKGWRRPVGYGFAAKEVIAPLGGSEFAHAVAAMPIGFAPHGGRYMPMALLGVHKERNIFVASTGQWLGRYVPAVFRTYPFSLGRSEGSETTSLCVDEDSGLIVDAAEENAEKFFAADGQLAPTTNSMLEFLRHCERDQIATDLAVAALVDAGMIKPWPLTLALGNQQVKVEGLSRVDEPALNALDDAAFIKLRKASALVIAHGQLLSMAQTSALTRLAVIAERMSQAPQMQPPPDASDTLPV